MSGINWAAIQLRWKANELIAADRDARGDYAGAERLRGWNRMLVRGCEIICRKPEGAFAGMRP
ncbi:MAG: hypothetical protein ACLGJD_05480 [Gammaproteobacteria bacterium]